LCHSANIKQENPAKNDKKSGLRVFARQPLFPRLSAGFEIFVKSCRFFVRKQLVKNFPHGANVIRAPGVASAEDQAGLYIALLRAVERMHNAVVGTGFPVNASL
jgi:hypothetical protein